MECKMSTVRWFLYMYIALCSYSLALRDNSFRFRVPAGWHECFYEDFDSSTDVEMDVYFEVIRGGDLDIKVSISSPKQLPIMPPNIQKKGGMRGINTDGDGTYTVCLDNTFSHISDKVVFLNLIVHEKMDEAPTLPATPEDSFNDTSFMVSQSVHVIKQKLLNVSVTQRHSQSREARHLGTVQSNLNRVFVWSLIETLVMVTVFLLQVVIIRRLVGGNRRKGIST